MLFAKNILLNIFLISYLQPYPLTIDGPNYFKFAYYENITDYELFYMFEHTGFPTTLYFVPSLNFNLLGETKYIIHAENKHYEIEYSFTIEIIDDIPPSIFGVDQLILDNNNHKFDTVLGFFKGYDDYDGYLDVNIKDYDDDSLTLYCLDSSSNEATKKVELIYQGTNYNLYFKQDAQLNFYQGEIITPIKLIEKMKENNYIENITNYSVAYLKKDDEINNLGKHEVLLELIYKNETYNIPLIVNVLQNNKRTTLIARIINFFKNFFLR